MSLAPNEIARLVALGAPIFCPDTCTLLDVIRDISRESATVHDALAGLALLAAAQTGRDLVVLVSNQVQNELAVNEVEVAEDAVRGWAKFQSQANRMHGVATTFGVHGNLQIQHIQGQAALARTAFDAWKAAAVPVPHNTGIADRALLRVNAPRTPARRGKESMKDCVVLETYLEAAGQLRAAGLNSPIVFTSSNTKEYRVPNSRLTPADLDQDLAAVRMEYAASFGEAKSLLGL